MVTFVPLQFVEYTPEDMRLRADAFAVEMARRRTLRDFDPRPIPDGVLDACLRTAGSAPSGANMQPWHFVVVTDPGVKRRVREAAEIEEREFYAHRAPAQWLAALAPLGTSAEKPFLETAPALIAIFAESYGQLPDGRRVKHYYVQESVGIATGLLIAARHHAGLATLTHTPSPMGFLNEILGRPVHERAFLLLVVGHPAAGAHVPDLGRKPIEKFVSRCGGDGDQPPLQEPLPFARTREFPAGNPVPVPKKPVPKIRAANSFES